MMVLFRFASFLPLECMGIKIHFYFWWDSERDPEKKPKIGSGYTVATVRYVLQ
jgi:hypothetical protein